MFWLAGWLEGEGSFIWNKNNQQPLISAVSTDEDVIKRVSILFGVTYFSVGKRCDHHKEVYRVCLRGRKAVDLMHKLKPLMGLRRTAKIDEVLAVYDSEPRIFKLIQKDVDTVRSLAASRTMTQSEIADKVGISREMVNKILNNKVKSKAWR